MLELKSGIIEYRVERKPSTGDRKNELKQVLTATAMRLGQFKRKLYLDSDAGIFPWAIVIDFLPAVYRESVLAFPSIGIQIETHRGLALSGQRVLNAGTSRYFLPISAVSDIVINEGLCLSMGESRLQVVFQASQGATLLEVYHGLHETLFDEWDEEDAPTVVSQRQDASKPTPTHDPHNSPKDGTLASVEL
ncbi:unnamed protein product [Rhizoctonia solani]|uniref:Phosphatidylinositol N-acetylglucosaminyltransferase subunit H conserved domain-containing protein n=1 Tax=Rhizoctonia solani TaxID=456999 RepID=A0A8H2WE57_9AGAM|nr:unnamed protein product [Rhizoctonia solani]